MSIRQRTLIVIGVATAAFIALLLAFSQYLLNNSYVALETSIVTQDMQGVRNAFASEIGVINALTNDWSNWDSAYAFGRGEAPEFIESELNDDIISNIDMSVVVLIDSARKPLYAVRYDSSADTTVPLDDASYQAFAALMLDESLPPTEIVSGYIVVEGQPFLVSTKPLLPSRPEPPASGALLFARALNAERIASLNKALELTFELFVASADMPADVAAAYERLSAGATNVIVPLNNAQLNAYLALSSLNGSPDLVLRLSIPRTTYQQGQATLGAFLLFITVSAVIAGALLMVMLERGVLQRIRQLSDQVSAVTAHNFTAARLKLEGNDELGKLANDINDLLRRIDEANKTISTSLKTIDERTTQLRRTRELLMTTIAQLDDAFQRGAHPDELRDYLIFAQKQVQDIR